MRCYGPAVPVKSRALWGAWAAAVVASLSLLSAGAWTLNGLLALVGGVLLATMCGALFFRWLMSRGLDGGVDARLRTNFDAGLTVSGRTGRVAHEPWFGSFPQAVINLDDQGLTIATALGVRHTNWSEVRRVRERPGAFFPSLIRVVRKRGPAEFFYPSSWNTLMDALAGVVPPDVRARPGGSASG